MVWRVLGGLAALVFVACAAVQLDDPDPVLWIGLYLGAAATSWPLVRARPTPRWAPLFIGVYAAELAVMGQLFPPMIDMDMGGPGWLGGEVERELAGCLLVVSWATVLSFARPFAPENQDARVV